LWSYGPVFAEIQALRVCKLRCQTSLRIVKTISL